MAKAKKKLKMEKKAKKIKENIINYTNAVNDYTYFLVLFEIWNIQGMFDGNFEKKTIKELRKNIVDYIKKMKDKDVIEHENIFDLLMLKEV